MVKAAETAFGQFGQRSVRTGDWENEEFLYVL